ncbi:hypothetical protein MKW98_026032 [Papaver atlanticum]|uniref:Uncharacterized protein n=1 Tax=Papaver atlanticum TaxID=357466 RepID=A0AAD4RXZ6_9MAGN|nr:hypothetical protein MKW98_026032 [Papaver atlanticum]
MSSTLDRVGRGNPLQGRQHFRFGISNQFHPDIIDFELRIKESHQFHPDIIGFTRSDCISASWSSWSSLILLSGCCCCCTFKGYSWVECIPRIISWVDKDPASSELISLRDIMFKAMLEDI